MPLLRRVLNPIAKPTFEVKIIEKEWGIERVYKSVDGTEHFTTESLILSSDFH